METTVFDVVHMFSEGGISAVPIVDEDGIVVNLYETVDVIVSYASVDVLRSLLDRKRLNSVVIDSRASRRLPIP